jgi:integrase
MALRTGVSPNSPDDSELMRTATLTQLRFQEAATVWLESRRGHISPRTFIDYGYYIKFLSGFFQEMKILEITGDQVRAYQRARRATAGPGLINKECGIIIQMRKRVGIPLIDYQPLQMPKDYDSPGKVLSESEEETMEKVCKIIAEHPNWKVAALACLVSMKSGLGPGELLSLRLKDIAFEPEASITVPRRGAKRVRRERTIAIGATAIWALEQLVLRAMHECGAKDGDDFLIPFQNKDHTFDPSKPGRGYRAGMKRVVELTGLKIRRYDLRHHAASRALSNPAVSLQAAVRHFGWIGPKMIGRYYHESLKESRIIADALEARKSVKSAEKLWMPRKSKKTG